MDDEEEIVFEGTPLAQHLESLGVEFDAVPRDHSDLGMEYPAYTTTKETETIEILNSKNSTIIDIYYRRYCMELIVNSNLLIQEDSTLLKEFLDEVNSSHISASFIRTLKRGTLDAVMIGLMFKNWIPFRTLRQVLSISIPAFVAWRWRSIWSTPAQARKLETFLGIAKQVDGCIKKAVCMIVDCSLINRGYLLLKQGHSAEITDKSNILELSKRSKANLPGLRKAVLKACERLAFALRFATYELRGKRPLPFHLDHKNLYFPELEVNINDDEDDYDYIPTMENIKSAANKHVLLRTEYLRRLFLHLLFTETSPMDVMWSKNLQKEMINCLQAIEGALLIYKPYAVSLVKPREITAYKSTSYLGELVTSCHSTSAHVHEALISSLELENNAKECKEFSDLDIEKVDDLIGKMIYHLKCAGLCIEHTVKACGRRGLNKDSLASAKAEPESETSGGLESKPEVRNEERIDIAPCDEIFEFYNRGGRENSLDKEEGYSSKSTDHRGHDLVLQELKNVLAVRAADWKERERNAKKQRLGDLSDLDMDAFLSDTEDDEDKESSDTQLKSHVVRKKHLKEMKEGVSNEGNLTSQEIVRDKCMESVINEVCGGLRNTMACNVAAEAVAKAREQLSIGLMSNVNSYGSSDSEEND